MIFAKKINNGATNNKIIYAFINHQVLLKKPNSNPNKPNTKCFQFVEKTLKNIPIGINNK